MFLPQSLVEGSKLAGACPALNYESPIHQSHTEAAPFDVCVGMCVCVDERNQAKTTASVPIPPFSRLVSTHTLRQTHNLVPLPLCPSPTPSLNLTLSHAHLACRREASAEI